MKLIITRALADAEALVPRLAAMGHEGFVCPLMDIRPRAGVVLPKAELQAVCASSANGLRADLDWHAVLQLPFFAVGPQSAEAARQRGFADVRTASGGNLQALAQLLSSSLSTEKGAVLYLSGVDVSADLAALVQATGLKVERVVVYEAVVLPVADIKNMLAHAEGVLLYSPRAARLWVAAGGAQSTLTHFCLSANVAVQLPQSVTISVAKTPDDRGMMELLDQSGEAE